MIKEIKYAIICLCIVGAASDSAIAEGSADSLPSFSKFDCPQNKYDLCLDVFFQDSEDKIMANVDDPEVPLVLKGFLDSNGKEAVVILKDSTTLEDTVVFQSDKAFGCTRFSADILGSGETTCLNDGFHANEGDDEAVSRSWPIPEDRSMDRSQEEMELSPRALDPNGYKLKVAVYYDDLFDKQFGSAAKTRVHAVMAIVDEMYSEKDTLKTQIKINVIGVKHAVGQSWGGKDWRTQVLGENLPTGRLAKQSPYDANLYVFLTGRGPGSKLGLAGVGTVCRPGRGQRTSVCKYAAGSEKGGDAYTAETIAHEMGHNLGMSHDFADGRCGSPFKCYKIVDGVACKGYMDYTDSTNYWSHCSVNDFTDYINRQKKFCLAPLNGSGGSGLTCSATQFKCGDGSKCINSSWKCDKYKDCPDNSDEKNCGTSSAVNGKWSNWGSTSCSVTCGRGVASRKRTCNNPAPSNGGAACVGSATNTGTCNTGVSCSAGCEDDFGFGTCQALASRCNVISWMGSSCAKTCGRC